jgi:3',5'-cyclic AMP phosphodiesterase CpdA
LDKRALGLTNYFLHRRLGLDASLLEPALSLIRTLAPDWVVCTGDITSVGSPEEFAAAREALAPLTGGELGKRLIFVPGNHDAYVRNRACCAALERSFSEWNAARWSLADLPQRLSASRLSLWVVDECCCTNWFLSSGRVSNASAARLDEWLAAPRAAGEKRVLVGHFPLRDQAGRPLGRRRRLVGAEPLAAALRDGRLDVSLCGHEHRPFVRREASGAMEICAGALLVAATLNVVDYSEATGRFTQFWVNVPRGGVPAVLPALLVPQPTVRGGG